MYIIRRGSVGVLGKHNHMVGLLGAGEHFGEIALFTEVRACEGVRVRVCVPARAKLFMRGCTVHEHNA